TFGILRLGRHITIGYGALIRLAKALSRNMCKRDHPAGASLFWPLPAFPFFRSPWSPPSRLKSLMILKRFSISPEAPASGLVNKPVSNHTWDGVMHGRTDMDARPFPAPRKIGIFFAKAFYYEASRKIVS
ncbi:MAG TPA: hypothetical protein VF903_01190, partial [Nitrospirota bacterium]